MSRRIDKIDASMESNDLDSLDRFDAPAKTLGVLREQVRSINLLVKATQDQNQKISGLTTATENLLEETEKQLHSELVQCFRIDGSQNDAYR